MIVIVMAMKRKTILMIDIKMIVDEYNDDENDYG